MIENWIVPCSIKFFDVVRYFENNNTIVWKRGSAIHVNDIVYIYVGAPLSEIKFKCKVILEKVEIDEIMKNKYAVKDGSVIKENRYMKLELLETYEDGILPWKELKQHGLGQVQIQARTDRKLLEYIHNIIDNQC
ncbi:hypothetical protein KQH93_04100 [Coprococcus comes]|nr:hypothetical protein [Coprococcus comes]